MWYLYFGKSEFYCEPMHQLSVYLCEHAGMQRAMESKTKTSIGTGQMTPIRPLSPRSTLTERYQNCRRGIVLQNANMSTCNFDLGQPKRR